MNDVLYHPGSIDDLEDWAKGGQLAKFGKYQ
jgi:hypothetical protein